MSTKMISALCITYGRSHLLEEAIEAFLKQDYQNKELIIVNDLPEQKLIFDHPQVKVFNFDQRFSTIGAKRNKSVELSSGEILTSWDDDDLYLPWLLSTIVNEFEKQPNLGFIQPNKTWCLNGLNVEKSKGWCAHTAFTRESFNEVGGYKLINSGQDMDLVNRLKKHLSPAGRAKELNLTYNEACYVFRWNTGAYHLSGYGRDKEGKESGFSKIEKAIKSQKIEPQKILNPHWNHDYMGMINSFLASSK